MAPRNSDATLKERSSSRCALYVQRQKNATTTSCLPTGSAYKRSTLTLMKLMLHIVRRKANKKNDEI